MSWYISCQGTSDSFVNMYKLQDGQTFLMVACQFGEPVIIEELLSQEENESLSGKTDVNALDNVRMISCSTRI